MSEPVFTPNPQLLEAVMAMGISKSDAEIALYYTGNDSADAAASYVFDNLLRDNTDEDDAQYKMIFVVNSSLNMGVGKIASQVSHACLGLYRILAGCRLQIESWEENGEKMVVLKGTDTSHIFDLQIQANNIGLKTYVVEDAGRTEVKSGSMTVLAVYGLEKDVDQITGNLELLK